MATLAALISRVRSAFKLVDADNVISNRVCADELRAAALKLIKQQTDKRRLLSSDNIFTVIKCLQMQQVSITECCSYKDGCMIARSTVKLPKVAENIYGPMAELYTIKGNRRFDYADVDRYANLMDMYPNKKGLRYWWIQNGYIYLSDPLVETVTFRAFFEETVNPVIYECNYVNICPDNPMDLEFKCPGYLESDIVNMARDMIARDYKKSLEDKTVDNNDESK